jgi:hypothetical protein
VLEKILRALGAAESQPDALSDSPHGPTRYHWRCVCGAHSRADGFLIAYDAEYAAQRHMWNQGVGHPMPDVYSTE